MADTHPYRYIHRDREQAGPPGEEAQGEERYPSNPTWLWVAYRSSDPMARETNPVDRSASTKGGTA